MVQTLSLAPIQKPSDGNMGTILEALMKKKAEEAKNKEDLFKLQKLQQVSGYFGAEGQAAEGEETEAAEGEETEEGKKKKGTASKLGGAASGAMTGAKIGSVFGPVGTGVGAVIGGIGGYFS